MKEFAPRSQRQNEVPIEIGQHPDVPFRRGVFNDLAVASIPRDAVKESVGYIPFEDRMETCGGCRLWSATTLPGLTGRTGYSWSKTGNRITKTAGTDFTSADVGNWIVHDDGTHELISAYVNADQVDVESSTTHAASTAGWMRGQINATFDHKTTGKKILHIDTRLFIFDSAISAYTRAYCITYRDLLDSYSVIDTEGDSAIIWNAGGLFRIDLSVDSGYLYWKTNTPVPRTLITEVSKSITKTYGHKYTYSMSRLAGSSVTRTRMDSVLEHETGTCLYSTTDYKDYAEHWDERPIGLADTFYGTLTGAALASGYATSSGWVEITNGQFSIAIDGVTTNFAVDFSGVNTMSDVARRIQAAMRTANVSITCEFVTDHFLITNPVEGGTVGYVSAGSGGTDIGSSAMGCESGTATTDNAPFTDRRVIQTLYCPTDLIDTAVYQWLHTHYSIWRSLNIGPEGIDPITAEGNNEEQLIWAMDVPIAKAFVASRTAYTVTATEGTFQRMDEGAKLRFQDGTEITLEAYVSPTEMFAADSGSISSQAAAIGGDNALSRPIRVLTASQTGTAITRTAGSTFSSADVGKPVFWPNGLRSHIIAFVDADHVTANESNTITSTGACMDPKCRNFTDTVRDEELRTRVLSKSLSHRLWQELPDCDAGALTPGWVFAAVRDTKIAYYGEVSQEKEHLIGYYYPARQYLKFKDNILAFSPFPDVMTVYCSNTTTILPTNTFINFAINNVQKIALISGQTVADETRGVWDCASFRKMPDGNDIVITSEPRLRFFDGRSFSADIADKRYTKTIEKFERAVSLLYEATHGLSIYGKEAT